MRKYIVGILAIAVGLLSATRGLAATACEPWIAEAVSIQGHVEAKRRTQTQWIRVQLNDTYCGGDIIRAGTHSRAGLLLRNQTVLRLDQGATIVLPEIEEKKPAWLELIQGAAHLISNIPYRLKVKTPFVNGAIEGTEFALQVTEKETRIWVFEGKVVAENAHGRLILENGDAALAEAGKAPTPLVVIKPRDAVQWALYYPPIIDYRPEVTADPMVQQAINFYRTGQITQAIAVLSKVPSKRRNARYFTLRAGLMLSVGRVEQARNSINKAQSLEPDNGTALALLSVIALVQNQKEQALSLARDAAKKNRQSSTPQVALSYAHQAAFDIKTARDSIKKALRLSPDDPLAWARLSELELSLGDLDDAVEAAEKAAALDPDLPRTQMVLGFARLMRIDLDEATEAFQKAIELDPAAPLPRLGQGLVKIRRGDVEEGAKDIEVAAILDPDNSLVRSYLGKAYYEEKREGLASREFAIAKELDSKDPTPWFYDAILKQTENRPVEALHDMQKAIELNDNRAVFRSKMLMDRDEAARSASLGRIYKDLGFEELALLEGRKSVNIDNSDHSGHRLLADSYSSRPRHEIARTSELLQSQLLQPLNINHLQPQLAEASLQILEGAGPSDLSFNEFNPLFVRDRVAFQTNVLVGNNQTFADDVVLSGIEGPVSWSLGQFHYETNGFRKHADLKHDTYNVFVQAAVTPNLSLQAEYRRRETDQGDLQLNFEPDDFGPADRGSEEQDTVRIGARYSPMPGSDFVISGIYTKRDENQDEFLELPPGAVTRFRGDDEGYRVELQYLYKHDWFNAAIGGGKYDIDTDNTLGLEFPGPFPKLEFIDEFDTQHENAYLYANVFLPSDLTWTLGLSYDSFDGSNRDVDKVFPKLGILWNVTERAQLRLAYFRTIMRPLAVDRTIEPTQVAGFNQFFDDTFGSEDEANEGDTFEGILCLYKKRKGDIGIAIHVPGAADLVARAPRAGTDQYHHYRPQGPTKGSYGRIMAEELKDREIIPKEQGAPITKRLVALSNSWCFEPYYCR